MTMPVRWLYCSVEEYYLDLNKTRLEQTRARQTGRDGDNVVTQLDHTGTKHPLITTLHYVVT